MIVAYGLHGFQLPEFSWKDVLIPMAADGADCSRDERDMVGLSSYLIHWP
jgi:hypothetical protein